MYEVLCTCITAPLEGLPVDKAKYSENVGHHLVCWIFEIQRTGTIRTDQSQRGGRWKQKKIQMKIGATNGTHPLTRAVPREREMDNDAGFGNSQQFSLPELVTTFCEPGTADVGFSTSQI